LITRKYEINEDIKVSMEQRLFCCLLHAGFFLGLLSIPEDGGDIFPFNIGCLSTDCTVLYHRRQNTSTPFKNPQWILLLSLSISNIYYFLGCNAVKFESSPTRNILPPSSGWKSEPSKQPECRGLHSRIPF
jgi:hypothetical protein